MKKAIVAMLRQGKDKNFYVKLMVEISGFYVEHFLRVTEEKYNSMTEGEEIEVPAAVLK